MLIWMISSFELHIWSVNWIHWVHICVSCFVSVVTGLSTLLSLYWSSLLSLLCTPSKRLPEDQGSRLLARVENVHEIPKYCQMFSLEILLDISKDAQSFFFSQQDTVVALKALSEFSALMHTENTNIQVTVTGPSSPKPIHFRIDTQNRFLLHTAKVQTGVVV